MASEASEQFVGPISAGRKSWLIALAKAFGVDSEGTRDKLIPRLKAYRDAHEDRLSVDPKFQGLIHYRGGAGKGQAESKVTGKNSADKATEDLLEGQKPVKAATG